MEAFETIEERIHSEWHAHSAAFLCGFQQFAAWLSEHPDAAALAAEWLTEAADDDLRGLPTIFDDGDPWEVLFA